MYGGWLTLTYNAAALPWWLVLPAGAWLVCWFGSLQHEVVHGHPTRWPRLNAALVWIPLGMLTPIALYREMHLRHHASSALTDPIQDTESFFVRASDWSGMSRARRALLSFNNTLLGRFTVGPALVAAALLNAETRRLLSGDLTNAGIWSRHLLGIGLVLGWVVIVCDLPAWAYIALFAYPGFSLTLLRSFAEHQPAADRRQRTALVIGCPLSGLLYLNNNLHVVHHTHPGLPWFAIPAEFRTKYDAYASQTGGRVYRGYTAILRRFLFHRLSHPVHPEHRPVHQLA